MKINLPQWTESVGRSIKKIQKIGKRVWIKSIPTCLEAKDNNEESINKKAVLKYKRVDQKIRPVPKLIPEHMKAHRQFPNNPLQNLPILPHHPPEFKPTTKVTEERMAALEVDSKCELLPEERKLLKHILVLNERSIAFAEEERGTFRRDYFSDYKMPTVEHQPWQDKNMPIPHGYKDEIIRLLKEKIDHGVYEEAQSSYRSRWFCVKKKNGELRIVHDLQKLNGVSIRDSGVPPILEEFVEAYAGQSVYTVLDMYWGFHARMLDVDSRDMTAFQTPLGVLRIASLPMGYTNSPAEFQACMMFILQDEVPDKAGVFIDDIPIKGPPTKYITTSGKEERIPQNPGIRRYIWEHLSDVHRILHRIGEAGGTVSGKKMQLCQSEVEIVGHKCSSKGREPIDSRTKKVKEWPRPRNLKEVRGFLGLCGTVRIWIRDYSILSKPLVDLTRKDAEFEWGPLQEVAFNQLKHLVTLAPALKPINYKSDRPVYLSVDTSIYGIGFILSQEDENGRRAPARYGSLPLKTTEALYGQSKLELYGLFRALRHYRAFIVGVKNLIVEVDASSIKGMLDNPDIQASAVINRWIQGVKQFDFKLVHVPAYKHKGPDALSRRRFTDQESSGESDPEQWVDDIALLTQVHYDRKYSNPSHTRIPNIPYPQLEDTTFMDFLHTETDDITASWAGKINHQEAEDELNLILRYLVTHKDPELGNKQSLERFKHKAEKFYLQGVHLYRRKNSSPDQVVIFQKNRRRAILWEMHEENGHHGVWAVAQQTTLRYFWPNIKEDIKHHIQSCHTCQLRSTKKMHLPITSSYPSRLFSKVYLDVMKMPKAQGKQWLVACRDDLSGITECKAIARDRAKTIAKFFLNRIILRYGTVLEVVTDNGPSFKKDFKKLLQKYGIKQIRISPYNSQANGVVERGHYNIREALVKLCKGDLSKWPLMVSAACYADRITTRRATGFSPFYLLHGVHPFMPCDLADATFMVTEFKPGMTDEELIMARTRQLLRMPQDVEKAQQILKKSRFRSKEAYEAKFGKRIQKEYEPGALVLVRNNPIENSVSIERKTANRYMGPYRVTRQTQGGSYVLEEMNGNVLRQTTAAFRLIPYIQRKNLDDLAQELQADNSESEGETSHRGGGHTSNSSEESDPAFSDAED
jgi:transposase InsO family protein